MSKLVIVESPKKAKTISGKLDDSFKVVSTKGHIKDLPKKRIGIDVEHNFECEWVTVPGKEKLIKEIIQLAEKSDQILLASDPDREGEAIAYHIHELLKEKNANIKRIVFNEITQNAIINAIKSPRDIDWHLFESQKARRILDRLVGFLLSPLLIYFLKRNLSAGRVQSIALKLIVDQEKAILAFIPEEYWRVYGIFTHDNHDIELELKKIDGKKPDITNGDSAGKIEIELKKSKYIVADVLNDHVNKTPPDPFKTSTLQQEANIRLGFSGKKTMMIAQGLYEGKNIGKEEAGLITYMRTDSVRVSEEAKTATRAFILNELGLDIASRDRAAGRAKAGDIKIQDAHEAIRPADPALTPQSIAKYLGRDEFKLYDLIWRRYIASFLKNAVYKRLSVHIKGDDRFLFEADFLKLDQEGFLKIYKPVSMVRTVESMPEIKKGDRVSLKDIRPEQHFTEPPKRFSEATLIKALEKQGIGRPSTYATILDTLKKRDYIRLEKKTIYPLPIGVFVTGILDCFFKSIINVHFTAEMEEKLDAVEQGRDDWVEMIRNYYRLLHKSVNTAKKEMSKGLRTEVECPVCGSGMTVRFSSKGEYLACSNYPACTAKRKLGFDDKFNPAIEDEKEHNHKCPSCGKKLLLKKGRYGEFYGCEGYPECKYTEPLEKEPKPGLTLDMLPDSRKLCSLCNSELKIAGGPYSNYMLCQNPECRAKSPVRTGIPCPDEKCGGELVERHKQNRPYYACSNYPKCRITVPFRPVARKCPECGYKVMYLTESRTRTSVICANRECKYREITNKNGDSSK